MSSGDATARRLLTTPRLVAAAVLLGVVLAAAAIALRPTGRDGAVVRDGSPVAVRQSVTPASALFGDRVEAELDVSSVDDRVDPGSVRIETNFRPYVKLVERMARSGDGGVTLHRADFTLSCLTDACLAPRNGVRTFRFAPAVVSFRQDGKARTVAVPWNDVRVTSRLAPGRAGLVEEPPRVDKGLVVSPTVLRAVLATLAMALGAAGAWLVLTGLRPGLSPAAWRRRRLTPLELALEQLDAAARVEDEAARRRVLDELATRLEEFDAATLEQQTRRLAWERTPPAADDLVALGERVRTGVEGARR